MYFVKSVRIWRNGRRVGLRIQWATVQVQVLLSAPSLNSLNFFFLRKMFGLFCFISEFESFNG